MPKLSTLINEIKGDRSIRQMSKDSGVSASYITGLLHDKYTPSIRILSKLTDPKSKPQKIISIETLSDTIIDKTLCDDYDEELEIRINNISRLLTQCVDELNEISRIRLERHLKKKL